MRNLRYLWAGLLLSACASQSPPPQTGPKDPAVETEPVAAQPADTAAPASIPGTAQQTKLEVVALKKGEQGIRRAELEALVARGGHWFIQQVDVRPRFRKGRFAGWRIRAYRGPGSLKRGDIVVGVNGSSLERPEQFMKVWNGLAQQKTLEIEIERAGRRAQHRFVIVE